MNAKKQLGVPSKGTPKRSVVNRLLAMVTAFGLCLLTLGLGPAALAIENAPPGMKATESVVRESLLKSTLADKKLVANSVTGATMPLGDIDHRGGSVKVPTDLEHGVTLRDANGSTTHIALPNASSAGDAQVLDSAVVTYPGEHSANTVVVGDLGVQMLTTIANYGAPTRYEYRVSLVPGQRLTLTEYGPVVLDERGEIQLAVGAPWAKDSNGRDAPTHYEVTGDTLTQVVEHRSDVNVAYPVTADPIWLAPWVVKCLIGIGIRSSDIMRIFQLGTPAAIAAAFGRGAVACIFGK
ncbi:hypothetical protein [Sinomonas albida]|uniref:hypothetical protein n=1 Tax=Sinomonas albida TaxID=369942 RepID=UPI0010A785EB|nr:hypothetical protein [Sinomonas albida]